MTIDQPLTVIKPLHSVNDASTGAQQQLSHIVCGDQHVTGISREKTGRRITGLTSFELNDPLSIISSAAELKKIFPDVQEAGLKLFLPGYKVTLVPDALYEPGAETELFGLNQNLAGDEEILQSHLKHLQGRLLYSIPSALRQHLSTAFHDMEIHHRAASWIDCLFVQYKNVQDQHVHIEIDTNGIQMAVFNDGQLQFFNMFLAASDEDKLYFMMFVSEQLKVNPHKDTYYISGAVRRGDELHNLMSKYIKNLKWQPRPPIYEYSLPVANLPEHFYYQSFCTLVCE